MKLGFSRSVALPTGSATRKLKDLLSPSAIGFAIRRECSRADRTHDCLSTVLFCTADSGSGRRMKMRLARTVIDRARISDDLGWFDDGSLCAVLPGTDAIGARNFAQDALDLLGDRSTVFVKIYSYHANRWDEDDINNGSGHRGTRDTANLADNAPRTDRRARDASARTLFQSIPRTSTAKQTMWSPRASQNVRSAHSDRIHLMLHRHPTPSDVGNLQHPMIPFLVDPMPIWKRAIDIVGASAGLLLTSPILIGAALAIKFSSSGPVVFWQKRAGLGGRVFTIYKFRTMVVNADAKKAELRQISEQDGPAFKLRNDPRVTRIGSFLRKTSLDELPQLWNVLMGDMSLVGPRPLPIEESIACEPWHRHRLNVTPGLTCIWQVKGRSRVTFAEWMRMDMQYIRARGFFSDLKLLFMTVPSVLLRRGAH